MIYDLVIIGGGPAGITAGIYAARQNLKTLLITKEFGGQIAKKAVPVENYPGFKEISGLELIQKFKKHLEKFKIDSHYQNFGVGVEIKKDSVVKIKKDNESFEVLTESKNQFEAETVVVASGASPKPLEVPGEKKYIGKGVSYCTTCDGPLFKDKIVAVIGGGNAGFEAALFLSDFARRIYILEYGPRAKADVINQEKVDKTGKIKIITSAALKEIRGESFVSSIIYQDLKSKKLQALKVEGVFIEIGSQPATSFLKNLVDFDKKDEVIVDPRTCETKTSGLFAAGDVTSIKYKQIVVACGEGAKAALSAYRYLQNIRD